MLIFISICDALSAKVVALPSTITPQTSIISIRELDRIRNEATMKTDYQIEQEKTIAISLANEREKSSNDRFVLLIFPF